MAIIHYREVVYQGQHDSEIIDEQSMLDLEHFAQVCGQSQEWVLELLESISYQYALSNLHISFWAKM